MGRLSYKGIAEVDAMNPCAGFAQICQLNNVPSDHQGTVLTCTYLAHTNIHQILWLIVYMEPNHYREILQDIFLQSVGTSITLEEINNTNWTIDPSGSPEINNYRYMCGQFKTINQLPESLTEIEKQKLLKDMAGIVQTLANISGKSTMQVIRDGLIVFDNKVV